MRLVKLIVVLLATVGLASLWYVATHTEIPTVAIGRVGAAMNLAYVRLVGRCSRPPSYDPRSGTLSFWIADDSGEIRVASYGAETRALLDQRRIPALGDEITVAGTLRMAEDFGTLTVDVPEHLAISRADPLDRAIGRIELEDQYERVRVRGEVRGVREPYQGLTLITLRDASDAIDVAVSEDLVALSGVTPTIGVGDSVEVVAAVSRYGETPQLVPASAVDLVRLDQPVSIAPERFIADLSRHGIGCWFTVRGAVTMVDRFSSGVKLRLDDGTGTITVLLWQELYNALVEDLDDALSPRVGAEMRVQGSLREYGGELEVIPDVPTDVEVLAAPAGPRSTSIGALTTEEVGHWVTLRGTLGDLEPFSAGVKALLSDDSGVIVLLLWQEIYDALPAADKLGPGVHVEVTGEIERYRGDLEIVPEAEGITVVE
jgi:DNA/RNA endonuclease YhcR with UshA esterase domain